MSEEIWELKIHQALRKLQQQNFRTNKKIYKTDAEDLFFRDQRRYTIRGNLVEKFEIFPWFVPPLSNSFRYRETLTRRLGEDIEVVTRAINFFFNETLDEDDILSLNEYYHLKRSPKKVLWTIVEVKSYLEDSRLSRQQESIRF